MLAIRICRWRLNTHGKEGIRHNFSPFLEIRKKITKKTVTKKSGYGLYVIEKMPKATAVQVVFQWK